MIPLLSTEQVLYWFVALMCLNVVTFAIVCYAGLMHWPVSRFARWWAFTSIAFICVWMVLV